jgi:hypothetical protein
MDSSAAEVHHRGNQRYGKKKLNTVSIAAEVLKLYITKKK